MHVTLKVAKAIEKKLISVPPFSKNCQVCFDNLFLQMSSIQHPFWPRLLAFHSNAYMTSHSIACMFSIKNKLSVTVGFLQMSFYVGSNFALFLPFRNNLSHSIRKIDGHMYGQCFTHAQWIQFMCAQSSRGRSQSKIYLFTFSVMYANPYFQLCGKRFQKGTVIFDFFYNYYFMQSLSIAPRSTISRQKIFCTINQLPFLERRYRTVNPRFNDSSW